MKLARKILTVFSLVLVAVSFSACGGGGGGGSQFYAGVWRFVGVNLTDDCNIGLPSFSGVMWTVNQAGSKIVLNSGSLTLEGTVNADDTGFDVGGDHIDGNGCTVAYAISTTISGDEGTAGLALGATCPGSPLVCTGTYAGEMTRNFNRLLELEEEDSLIDVGEMMIQGVLE